YFHIKHARWGGQTLYELYRKAYTPWEWFVDLKKASRDSGLIFFATAFDKTSVDFLEGLDVPFHKISSFELVDIPLIEYAAKTKKPLILSTGMATLNEISEALSVARASGNGEVVLLKCVSSYPARPDGMNLRTIPDMRKRFNVPVGLSDHSLGIAASVAAVCMGAIMVEKHFTLSKKDESVDSFFSIDTVGLKELVDGIRCAEKALGKVHYGLTGEDGEGHLFRRSLFAAEDIRKNQIFTEKNVRSVRPSGGLPPKHIYDVIGRKAKKDIRKGTPLRWELVGREGRRI
nr:pseudaminic acid synthase [Candidatus Omnitrophota bacterium]